LAQDQWPKTKGGVPNGDTTNGFTSTIKLNLPITAI
jgi:hypothetical protein